MQKKSRDIAWLVALEALLCLALWPIWSERFPPMQDYPQHLLQAQMLRVHNQPAFDYNQNFEFHLRPYYAAFTLATLLFSTVAPIEVAGKLALSLYPLLIALLVYRLGRRCGGRGAPWGALLFFPMAFNQQYFLGNTNYLLSLPLLFLALMDFEDLLAGPLRAWPALRQFLWQAALFIAHPFTLMAYAGLAIVSAIPVRDKKERFRSKVLLMAAGAILLLAAAWIESVAASAAKVPAGGEILWFPLHATLEFFALMFNGMQWSRGAQPVSLVLWAGVLAIVLGAVIARRKEKETTGLSKKSSGEGARPTNDRDSTGNSVGRPPSADNLLPWRDFFDSPTVFRRRALMLVPAVIAFFALPSCVGTFTFINLRVAAIIYFLLALMAADVEFRGWWRYALAVLLALTMADSIVRQERISAEVGEVVPVIERIPPNSRILPLVFDASSAELDPASSTRICTTTTITTSSSAAASIPISSRRRSFPCIIEKARSGPRRANITPRASRGRSMPPTINTFSFEARRNRSGPISCLDADRFMPRDRGCCMSVARSRRFQVSASEEFSHAKNPVDRRRAAQQAVVGRDVLRGLCQGR